MEPLVGDKDVFGDGSVIMLNTPGHTPGHHSLLVKLAGLGNVLITGDLAHFRENYDSNGVRPSTPAAPRRWRRLDRFKQTRGELEGHRHHSARRARYRQIAGFPCFREVTPAMLTFQDMQKTALIALLVACSFAAAAKDAGPVASRIAAQNALFEEQFQTDLKAHPERATAIGDYRYNDQLEDYSPAAYRRQDAADLRFLSRLNAISTAGFPEQDKLSHQVMLRSLTQRIANYKFKEYEMPVNHMEGPQVRFTDMPLAVPLDSVKHYEDYIARLHQIPRAFAQSEETLRAGMKDKLMPVRFLLEKVPAQCEGIIKSDPFLLPTKKFPDGISAADQQRLTKAITDDRRQRSPAGL